MVSLDALAQRYNLLPTQALEQATTFDLRVMEIANRYQHRKMNEQSTGKKLPTQQLSQDQMKAMIERVKTDPRFNGTKPRAKKT